MRDGGSSDCFRSDEPCFKTTSATKLESMLANIAGFKASLSFVLQSRRASSKLTPFRSSTRKHLPPGDLIQPSGQPEFGCLRSFDSPTCRLLLAHMESFHSVGPCPESAGSRCLSPLLGVFSCIPSSRSIPLSATRCSTRGKWVSRNSTRVSPSILQRVRCLRVHFATRSAAKVVWNRTHRRIRHARVCHRASRCRRMTAPSFSVS